MAVPLSLCGSFLHIRTPIFSLDGLSIFLWNIGIPICAQHPLPARQPFHPKEDQKYKNMVLFLQRHQIHSNNPLQQKLEGMHLEQGHMNNYFDQH